MPPAAAPPPSLRGRAFRTAEALACGVTREQLRGPAYRRIVRDVHCSADTPDTLLLKCDALCLTMPPAAVFSHGTAARLYGAPLPPTLAVEVCVPAGCVVPDKRSWIVPHEGDTGTLVLWDGRPLAAPEVTWLQLAPRLRLDPLVEVGDALLRWTPATVASMSTAVDTGVGRRGVVRAREALPLLRERVDSVMETRLRLLLVRAGLPCPEPGLDAYDAAGNWFARPDLSYPQLRIAIEYEGDHHRTSRGQFAHDVERDALYGDHGWVLVKVTAETLLHRPEVVVRRVRARLVERGWRPAA